MKDIKITNVLQGYFDVRKWSPTGERKNWDMKSDTDSIMFTVLTDKFIKGCEEFAKEYVNKHDETRFATTFKIGKNAKWYGMDNEECQRPTNAELDGAAYNVRFAYVTLYGDASKKEASGYWCNAVQLEKVETNPFKNIPMEKTKVEEFKKEKDFSETDFLNNIDEGSSNEESIELPY